jgi:hypothetical protein
MRGGERGRRKGAHKNEDQLGVREVPPCAAARAVAERDVARRPVDGDFAVVGGQPLRGVKLPAAVAGIPHALHA